MRRVTRFFAFVLMVLAISMGSQALAQTTPPANPPPTTPPANTQPKCALDEFPSTENGTTVCKKVPACSNKDEVISYDTATQKFVCKKMVQCDPKHQQSAYINGKNVCIDIPDCEKAGKHYVFDGSKMTCQ